MKKHFLLIVAATLLTSWSNAMQAQDALEVTASQAHITQNFDSMWDGTAATLTMPEGWRVDRRAQRLLGGRTINHSCRRHAMHQRDDKHQECR